MSYISANGLKLGYGENILVSDLSFEVNRGDYLCVVGENGAGKSTLIKTILGLQQPIEGTIIFSDELRKNEIGYLPQQTLVQRDFPASVYEIVLSGCQAIKGLRPFYTRSEKDLALANMKKLGIENLRDCCYRQLSGGQQQRVLLARALCATRKVLLLDEPVAGLDPKVTVEMYDIIEKLNREGITIIMISHDINAATKYASHILHVGKKFFFGTKENYLKTSIARYFIDYEEDVENE